MAKVLRTGKDNDKPILSKAKKDYETASKNTKEPTVESAKKPGSTVSVVHVRKFIFISFIHHLMFVVNLRPAYAVKRGTR